MTSPALVNDVWIDYESSGIDVGNDRIFEAGVVYLDKDLNVIEEFETVIASDAQGLARMDANQFVLDMHSKSGLLARLHDPATPKMTLAEFQAKVISDLDRLGREADIYFGGSGSSGFDYPITQAQMSELGALFPYWAQKDVRYARGLYQQASGGFSIEGDFHSSKTHRAIDDIRLHVAEWRAYTKVMRAGIAALAAEKADAFYNSPERDWVSPRSQQRKPLG